MLLEVTNTSITKHIQMVIKSKPFSHSSNHLILYKVYCRTYLKARKRNRVVSKTGYQKQFRPRSLDSLYKTAVDILTVFFFQQHFFQSLKDI